MSLRKIRLSYVKLIYEISGSSISSNSESIEKTSPSVSSRSSSEEKEEGGEREEGEEEEEEGGDDYLNGINHLPKSTSERAAR